MKNKVIQICTCNISFF